MKYESHDYLNLQFTSFSVDDQIVLVKVIVTVTQGEIRSLDKIFHKVYVSHKVIYFEILC